MPMGVEGDEGSMPSEGFRLQHSDGPGESNGNGSGRERAPDSYSEAASPPAYVPPPPPPPPEARPAVVWSSSASAADSAPRVSDREE